MRTLFHFLWHCFYALTPVKAFYGREKVASMLMGITQTFLMLTAAGFVDAFVFRIFTSHVLIWIVVLGCIVLIFGFTCKYFQKKAVQESIKAAYKTEKTIHKIVAVVSIALILFLFIECMDYLSEVNRYRFKGI